MSKPMLSKILNYFKRNKLCICHNAEHGVYLDMPFGSYEVIDRKLLGATLAWDGAVVPYNQTSFKCNWCEREFQRGGYLPRAFWESQYPLDEGGWPTVNGQKMEIAKI